MIRPFQSKDLEALYAIALATGHEGGDASSLYDDGRLIGHIYAAPYATLCPELALVAADSEGVAGFAVGVVDSLSWEASLERSWWPVLRQEYPDPGTIDRGMWAADQRRASMIHHPDSTPRAVTETYPAHLHLNLLPRLQNRGVGSSLLAAWLGRASEHGVGAVHVGVNRANPKAVRFWRKHGFERLDLGSAVRSRTIWMGYS